MSMRYMIFTGPMEVDWLVAEIYVDDEQFADIQDWGEKIMVYPRLDGLPWSIPVDELLNTIETARERVRFRPNEEEK